MLILKTGKLYHPSRRYWPETVTYEFRGGAHLMGQFIRSPTSSEVLTIRRGRLDLGLFVSGQLIVLLHRIPGVWDWSDVPYSCHLTPPADRGEPRILNGVTERARLIVHVVDASNGVFCGGRIGSMSPEFSKSLHDAIRAQMRMEFDELDYDREIREIYQTYPTSEDLLAKAAALCTLGD